MTDRSDSDHDGVEADVLDALKSALDGANSWLSVETAFRRSVPEGEEERFRAFVFAFGYMLHHEAERRREEGPFDAAIVHEQGRFPPPLSQVEDADVTAWRVATDELDNPIALSRLHDLLWERRDGDRPDLHARAAIDAYLSLSHDPSWQAIERVDCVTRALELARSVADKELAEAAVHRAIEMTREDLESDDGGPGVTLSLLEAVSAIENAPEEVSELIDAAGQRYGDDPFIADTVADLRVGLPGSSEDQLRREQVERWRKAAEEGDGILRAIHLQRALELAKTHGLSDLTAELRRELQEMKPSDFDLQTISAEIEIPTETIRALIDGVVGNDGWKEALIRLGNQGPPGGEPDDLDRRVDELKRAAPLQFLVTKIVIGEDKATTIFRAEDDESHRRLARAQERAESARLWSIFAADILDAIRERHGAPTREELTVFLTTDLIDAAVAERVARAFELYWGGQHDETAHMVTPRIEAVVRGLARRIGIPIVREPSGPRPGRVQSLGLILEQLRPFFGQPGWHAYLENLLTDQLGVNLRNIVSHGLRDRMDRSDAALLLHAVCYLRLLSLSSDTADEGD